MKLLVLFLFSTLTFSALHAQKGFRHDDAVNQGIRISELDSIYKSAIHTDPKLAVFTDQEAVSKAYVQLLTDLGKFLASKNFEWERTVSGFNRVYFDKDGSIDYFVYSFRGDVLSPYQVSQFDQLLNEFIKNYRFPLQADVKFAQCSPVTYTPKEKK